MNHKKLFYFDIETVARYQNIETLKENDIRGYNLFLKKYQNIDWLNGKFSSIEDAYLSQAPIYTPYGKIICLSFAYYNSNGELNISSIVNDDEETLMNKIHDLFTKVSNKNLILSGFNINSFDIPWLFRKILKYNLELPYVLDIFGKKPWEIRSFDLAEQWKFSYKHYASLDEVCYELDIESPKDNICGSEVNNTYWNSNNGLIKIKEYCEKDVLSTVNIAKKILL